MKVAPRSGSDYTLPLTMDITLEEFREIFPTWLQWQATEKRFLPTELRRQPQRLLDGVLYIDGIFEKIVGQIREQEEKKNKS